MIEKTIKEYKVGVGVEEEVEEEVEDEEERYLAEEMEEEEGYWRRRGF
jgi:hypothetical protein